MFHEIQYLAPQLSAEEERQIFASIDSTLSNVRLQRATELLGQ